MIPLAEARSFVLSSCAPLEAHPAVLADSLGKVLAETVRATESVPPFANSAMDGYAVRAADTTTAPARLRVTATVIAGDIPAGAVGAGEAARIMTGAPMPPGADAVCMVERTRSEEGGSVVIIQDPMHPGVNVRHAGEDVAVGDEVFAPGTPLGPAHIGVLASLGVGSVLTHPSPRVGVVSTGDELEGGNGTLSPGKIRDSNRPALVAQLRAERWDPIDLGTVGDNETALTRAFESAAARCDAIVTSGGVSVGDRDLVKVVLEKLSAGAMRWMQVAVKPAKPFAFGMLDPGRTPVFGLPGNPVSALVSYELLVRPALRKMAGFSQLDRPRLPAIAEDDLRRRQDGKLHFARVRAKVGSDGALRVRSSGGQASHQLRAMAGANALALLPDGEGIPAGGKVEVLLLDADRLQSEASGGSLSSSGDHSHHLDGERP